MKIGIFSNLYPPQARGGAELVAQRVADALYERGHDVFVLTTEPFRGVRSLTPRIRARHIGSVYRFFPFNLYYIKHDRFVPFPIRLLWHVIDLFNPFTRHAVRNLLRDEEPDVVISHNLKGLGVSAGSEIQRMGITHVHTLHDVQLSVPSGLLIKGQEESWMNKTRIRRWYERGVARAIGSPDLVLSPSNFLASFYKDRGMFTDSQVNVLSNPLPPVEARARGVRVNGPTRFLFVGQLEHHKGIMLMLDALEEYGEGIELHIAGDGALASYVADRASRDKRIHYHGYISLEHLVSVLQATDAVLVPSTCYENSPTVIYEAFQVGVPVIASRIGGIPELIEHGENGLLVEPGGKASLLDAMQQIGRERDQWWEKTQQIKQAAMKYSIKEYAKKLEQLIEKIK